MAKLNKIIIIITIVCLSIVFSISAFLVLSQKPIVSEKDFPLQVDIAKKVFNAGEKISFNATITNKSGRDINMSSNGEMPCVFFHKINDNTTHGETTEKVDQILKANDKISRVFEYEANETGTYILDAHYHIVVDNIAVQNKLDDIIIEVSYSESAVLR